MVPTLRGSTPAAYVDESDGWHIHCKLVRVDIRPSMPCLATCAKDARDAQDRSYLGGRRTVSTDTGERNLGTDFSPTGERTWRPAPALSISPNVFASISRSFVPI